MAPRANGIAVSAKLEAGSLAEQGVESRSLSSVWSGFNRQPSGSPPPWREQFVRNVTGINISFNAVGS
ncbi:hypothetical protein CKAH01_01647 [Colletotrichum kahawae]|uniref:Uncharacterized protein n=1 Tax=Colletotrichum kahawae TaxID=34407 RepID=A0AAE0D313_COLKA|nr:hypothetical protein CKAH01_01647 [Colletotrichum kahawae]